jgi:hypothetical protein
VPQTHTLPVVLQRLFAQRQGTRCQ